MAQRDMEQDAMLDLLDQPKWMKQPGQDAYASALGAGVPQVGGPKETSSTMPVDSPQGGAGGVMGAGASALLPSGPKPSAWQNPAAANHAFTSANAPRLSQGADGAWVLTEHGNRRSLQPSEAAAAQQYVSDFWAANPTGFQANNAHSVADAYRQFLGREGSAAELSSHAGNPNGFAGIIQTIAESPEAKAYAQRGRGGATGAPPPTTTGPWAKGEIRGSARQGADFARLGGGFGEANTDSLKHTFGRIAQNYAPTPEGLTALMNDPEFKQLFPNASLNKDWIDFGGQIDPHTGTKVGKIDVMHAWDPTNNTGKNWQWLTEEDALGGSAAAGGGSPQPALGGLPPSVGMAQAAPQGDDTMARILAEIQALQNGAASPLDQDAMRGLL